MDLPGWVLKILSLYHFSNPLVQKLQSKTLSVSLLSFILSLNVNNFSATEEEKERKKDSYRSSIKLRLRAGLWLVLLPVEGEGGAEANTIDHLVLNKCLYSTRAESEEYFLSHRPLADFALFSPEYTPA